MKKKVVACRWNPLAVNVLASTNYSGEICVWDVTTQQMKSFWDDKVEAISTDLKWSEDGRQFLVLDKNKTARIFDARSGEVVQSWESFAMKKTQKGFWASNKNLVGASGFGARSKRYIKCWDVRKIEKPVVKHEKDSSGVLLVPHYDEDTGVLYTYSKGASTIEWMDLIGAEGKTYYPVNGHKSADKQKNGCFVPKRACDTTKNEVARFLRLGDTKITPVSLIVPRKATNFQKDIFPESYSLSPGCQSSEYFQGTNPEKEMATMDPKLFVLGAAKVEKAKSYDELVEENAALRKRVEELEAQLSN